MSPEKFDKFLIMRNDDQLKVALSTPNLDDPTSSLKRNKRNLLSEGSGKTLNVLTIQVGSGFV